MPVASLLLHSSVPFDKPCKPPPGARSEFNNWGTHPTPRLQGRGRGSRGGSARAGVPAGVVGAWEWPEASLEEVAVSQPALWGPVTDSPFSQIAMNVRRLEAQEKPNGS